MIFVYIKSNHLQMETILFFPILTSHFFSCLISLAVTSSIMLNRIEESGHPFLGHNLCGNFSTFDHWVHPLCVCHIAFVLLTFVPSISNLRVCIINECWILSNAFSVSIKLLCDFYLLVYQCGISHNWLAYIESSLHSRDKFYFMMVYNPFNVLHNFGAGI